MHIAASTKQPRLFRVAVCHFDSLVDVCQKWLLFQNPYRTTISETTASIGTVFATQQERLCKQANLIKRRVLHDVSISQHTTTVATTSR
jgi:hypothetical protein